MTERTVIAVARDMNLGNKILELLIFEGWEVFSSGEFERVHTDSEWDAYTLKNNQQTIEFNWDGRIGWELSGPEFVIRRLAKDFRLRLKK